MKQKIVPGGELDLATADEIARAVAQQRPVRPETPVRFEANGRTDGAGNLTLTVYQTPMGRSLRLTRLIVLADGYTFSAPYTAGGYLLVLRNDVPVDGQTLATAPGLPAVLESGESSAAFYANGDSVGVQIVGGPANTNVTVRGQGEPGPADE